MRLCHDDASYVLMQKGREGMIQIQRGLYVCVCIGHVYVAESERKGARICCHESAWEW